MVKATVVICSEKPRYLMPDLFDDLCAQTLQDFEIIVAREKGIVHAMNWALERAKGEIFVRIDDDVRLPKEWLENLMRSFSIGPNSHFIAGATGPTFVPKERRKYRDSIRMAENPGWFLSWMFDNRYFAPASIYSCGSVSYDSNYEEKFFGERWPRVAGHLEGTNWAMRTDLIRQVGGFDQKFDGVCEWFDTDVEQKIKKLGYHFIYNPDAYLYHMLEQGESFDRRRGDFGRIKNWLRFHIRHSKFHPKMVIWFLMMTGYCLWQKLRP